ncbi:MAG: cobalamin-dependent protein [Oligoflexia bacterium]|nr:cobalamin-dependent protein [Oligoflexia bacterium]
MKILLINPPVSRPSNISDETMRLTPMFPLGLAYLSSYLKSKGHEIVIIDALLSNDFQKGFYENGRIRYGLSDNTLKKEMELIDPDVIGVTCLFSSAEWDARNIARISKEVNPKIKVFLGGVHATVSSRFIIEKDRNVDGIIKGEGEESFANLVELIESNSESYEKIDGVCIRRGNEIIDTPKLRFISDLDKIPLPDRTIFDFKKYLTEGAAHSNFKQTPFTQMVSSRGCPFTCTFCSLIHANGLKYRMRSARAVVDEIRTLVFDWGVKEIHFEDDNLTADKERFLEICKGIKSLDANITLNAPTGLAVAHLDEEILDAMKETGFYSICMGIESGDEYVLKKLMRKPVKLSKIEPLIRHMEKIDLESRGFFILGFPGETEETIKRTVAFAKGLKLDWTYFFLFTPHPGTEIYNTCVENKYIDPDEYDTNTYNYRFSILKNQAFSKEWLENFKENAIVDLNFTNNPNLLRGNYLRAIEHIGSVVKNYPSFDFAKFSLGEGYLGKGDIANAIKLWEETLKLNPLHQAATERLKQYKNY